MKFKRVRSVFDEKIFPDEFSILEKLVLLLRIIDNSGNIISVSLCCFSVVIAFDFARSAFTAGAFERPVAGELDDTG